MLFRSHLAGRGELARVADPDRREEEWEGMLVVAATQLVGLAKVGGETESLFHQPLSPEWGGIIEPGA